MSLYKRGSIWWMRFTTPDGQNLRETTQTSDQRRAQELHDRRKTELWDQFRLGIRPRYTWQQAVVRWLGEHPDHRGLASMISYLRRADGALGHLALDEIDDQRLASVLAAYRATGIRPATAKNFIATIRSVLNAAKNWNWIDRVPRLPAIPATERRLRWLTRDEASRLIAELPPHLAAMARFALATGLRDRNICGLEWRQVDVERRVAWIYADQAKARRVITVPLNADAITVLREQQGVHDRWVFTYRSRPIHAASQTAWYSALRRAGLEGLRFHDLRHTWASWHVQAGTPLLALKELGGWASLNMVLRYAHLAPDHLAEHAERIARPRLVRTKSDTPSTKKAVTK